MDLYIWSIFIIFTILMPSIISLGISSIKNCIKEYKDITNAEDNSSWFDMISYAAISILMIAVVIAWLTFIIYQLSSLIGGK